MRKLIDRMPLLLLTYPFRLAYGRWRCRRAMARLRKILTQ